MLIDFGVGAAGANVCARLAEVSLWAPTQSQCLLAQRESVSSAIPRHDRLGEPVRNGLHCHAAVFPPALLSVEARLAKALLVVLRVVGVLNGNDRKPAGDREVGMYLPGLPREHPRLLAFSQHRIGRCH
jgi:hypothetical protein